MDCTVFHVYQHSLVAPNVLDLLIPINSNFWYIYYLSNFNSSIFFSSFSVSTFGFYALLLLVSSLRSRDVGRESRDKESREIYLIIVGLFFHILITLYFFIYAE